MTADFQTQETVTLATDAAESIVQVLDLELMHVGGGTETGVLF